MDNLNPILSIMIDTDDMENIEDKDYILKILENKKSKESLDILTEINNKYFKNYKHHFNLTKKKDNLQ